MEKNESKTITVWVITGAFKTIRGAYHHAYTGWWLTRKEAIEQHTKELGKDWQYCKNKGDRAVKATLIFPITYHP